jgi:gluconate 2-dehydrogenase
MTQANNSHPKPKILVARRIFPEGVARLQQFCDVEYNDTEFAYSAQELAAKLVGMDGALVTGSEPITLEAIQGAKSLKVISNIAVGFNNFNLAAMTSAGILATNTPDVLTDTTADLGFALLMATARRVTESEIWLRGGHWKNWDMGGMLGVDIHHSTLGIVGMGRIGQGIAKRALGFGMKVIYHNRSRLTPELEKECQATYVDKDTLLKEADHVVLVMPYTPESHHFIGAKELAMMKSSATLVNLARGGIVDDAALAKALKEKVIFAAGLDVFEGEPKVHPDLLTVPNVVLTPHIGSASAATRHAMMNLAIDNLLAGLAGKRPPNLLNPDAFQGN